SDYFSYEWSLKLYIDDIFDKQEFNQEDINVFYAMFGRSCLPLKECGQRLFLGLYGTTTTGKTLLLDLLK